MLNIYVNTWGNYSVNGADLGEWIELPMDADELEKKLETIAAAMNDEEPEWFINDYEWNIDNQLRDICENENIFELNEEMGKLDILSVYEQQILSAACDVWGYEYVDIDELYNFLLLDDVQNDYDLGYYYAVESGCYDLNRMGSLANYIDYEAFGRDIRLDSNGGFSSYGWIEKC